MRLSKFWRIVDSQELANPKLAATTNNVPFKGQTLKDLGFIRYSRVVK